MSFKRGDWPWPERQLNYPYYIWFANLLWDRIEELEEKIKKLEEVASDNV